MLKLKKKLIFLIFFPLFLINFAHAQTELEEKETIDRNFRSTDEKNYSLELHKRNIKILNTAKNDLETFYLFVNYLKNYNKMDDLKLLEKYAREFVSKRIDLLLKRESTSDDHEVKKILFELQYFKALIFYECGDIVKACETLNNLESQYYQNMDVEVDFLAAAFQQKEPFMALTFFKLTCKKNKTN